MKFVKLQQGGKAFLVNLNNVSEVYITKDNKSLVYFNFSIDGEQVSVTADESLDEILEIVKQAAVSSTRTWGDTGNNYNTKRISRDPEINAYTRLGENVALKLMAEGAIAKAVQEYRNKNSRAAISLAGYQSDDEIMRCL